MFNLPVKPNARPSPHNNENHSMTQPDVLSVVPLPAPFVAQLEALCRVHTLPTENNLTTWASVAPTIRAIVAAANSRVDAALIAQLPALEIITVIGVGYDGIDVFAARQRGIMVTHTPDVLNADVADLAMGLMLSAARQIPQGDRHIRDQRWPQALMPMGQRVSGARLGLIGMGRIGQAIAQRAQAFGMAIAYTARSPKPELTYRFVSNATALAAEVDFLVVITPGGDSTHHLVNAEVLAALGKGLGQGVLINVARGSVVDQDALIDALEQGVIAGAGLDVFDNEPHVPERLCAIPHVVLTPHIGSATAATRQAMAMLAFDNLRLHLQGQTVKTPVPECR